MTLSLICPIILIVGHICPNYSSTTALFNAPPFFILLIQSLAVAAPVKEGKENRSRGLPIKPEYDLLRQGKDVKNP